MGYVRIKQIKGKPYAYWVNSIWTASGPRQKVKGYLGKIIALTKTQELSLTQFIPQPYDLTIKSMPRKDTFSKILTWHLGCYGFVAQANQLVHSLGLRYDTEKNTFVDNKGKNQKIVLKSSEGFLCEKTINQLFTFKEQGFDRDVGVKLAKAFVLAGIDINKEFFIAYFNRYMDEYVERGY